MQGRKNLGQSLVEFALAVPLLALLLGGIASFGFLLYAHVQVSNATREGARAGSQYLGSRLHYTVESKEDCWTLRQWVTNALVEYNRDSKGCPSTLNTTVHSFGRLNSARCSSTITSDCWELRDPLVLRDSTTGTLTPITTDTPAWIQNNALGKPLMVEVNYRYNVPFLGQMFNANPIIIQKAVIMRIQNN
jgi:hypothetical protein